MPFDPPVRYYLHHEGRSRHDGVGPIYAAPPFLQRGYGIGSFLAELWRVVKPVLWSDGKTLGR